MRLRRGGGGCCRQRVVWCCAVRCGEAWREGSDAKQSIAKPTNVWAEIHFFRYDVVHGYTVPTSMYTYIHIYISGGRAGF